jgi:hypothetical protein
LNLSGIYTPAVIDTLRHAPAVIPKGSAPSEIAVPADDAIRAPSLESLLGI